LSANASVDATYAKTESVELDETVTLMSVTQSKTADGHYRWMIEPRLGSVLKGRPWNSEEPRAKLVDKRTRVQGIEPTVRVEVRCKREDLVIEDLALKDASLWEETKNRIGFRNRLAVAESYIRDRLIEEGLEVENIHDPFGNIIMASVIADSTSGKK
jgi:hypothetical protein